MNLMTGKRSRELPTSPLAAQAAQVATAELLACAGLQHVRWYTLL